MLEILFMEQEDYGKSVGTFLIKEYAEASE